MKPLVAAAAVAISVFAAFLFLQPVFSNIHNWGLYDWDQHFFYHEAPRVSILSFGQFPSWTPYYCGGNPLLANPQSPFLSPFFAFVLAFGAVVGLKLEALVYLAIGLLGTFLAAGKLGCSKPASFFAAIAFMFSSWFAVRVVVGHTTFFPFALLPFVFLFYLSSASADSMASRIRWVIAAAIALAIMFLSGGIYPFYAAVILLVFYASLEALGSRSAKPLAVVFAMLLLAAVLSSVKLLPVLDFASAADAGKDVQLTSAPIVVKSLLSRQQSIPENDMATGRDTVPEGKQKELDSLAGKLPWGWHEYSAYIGIFPLLLAAAALLYYRKNWKLIFSALFFFLLALGNYLPLGPWQLVRQLPFFSSLHGPSRFIIVFAFLAALLAARALSMLRLPVSSRIKTVVVAVICLIVAADLLFVSRPLLKDAFPLLPLEIKSTNLGQPEFIQMLSSAPTLSQYPNLLQGIGTLNCYERLHLRIRPLPQFIDGVPYKGFIGNAYFAETNQSLNFTYFSPQRISLRLPQISSGSTLVVSQNYYKGWKADGGKALSFNGLLAAKVSPSDSGKEMTFRFSSLALALGSIVSALSAIAAALIFWKPDKAAAFVKKLRPYVFRQS
ncbi:hypothetical protein HYU17_03705 [Candidatus Woesearchaeota archaeon]|nr:hypothetical protein [Candidatus Woesearchaeota archaeon]